MECKIIVRLSEKEQAFVEKLALGMKPCRAATEAGWSVASARNLLKKAHIAATIRACSANLSAVVRRMDSVA